MIKKLLLGLTICFCATFASSSADESDSAKLQGNWEVKSTTPEGDKIIQRLEISKDKLIFKMFDSARALRFYAVTKLKIEKLGPFNVLKVTEIKGGDSESDLSPVDDDRTSIYQLREGKLILASNFEKEREDKPALDVYEKVAK